VELWLTNLPEQVHPWPSLGGSDAGTRAATASCVTETNVHRKALLTPQFIQSSVAIAQDGTLYVGTRDLGDLGTLYALNSDLSVKWQVDMAGYLDSTPTIGPDGTVYVGCTDHRLYCFNRKGCLRWTILSDSDIYSSPVLGADGTAFFGGKDFSFYALNPDGTKAWAFPADSAIHSSPALAPDGSLYFATALGTLYALDSAGGQKWTYPCGGAVYGGIALGADGTVYCATANGALYAIDATGGLRGTSAPGGEFRSGPCISGTAVYAGNTNGNFCRFDLDGNVLGSYDAGADELPSPGIADFPVLGISGSLPASVDLADGCAPIGDHGNWGSCTAWASGDGAGLHL
jgi:outer membrane protein assembly factor BamB